MVDASVITAARETVISDVKLWLVKVDAIFR